MSELADSVFTTVETAWSADSGGYNEGVRRQLQNRRDVRHWQCELRKVLGREPLRVLDVGCGPGFFTIMLARLGHLVTSMDGAEGMVACARRNLAAERRFARIYLGDAVRLAEEQDDSLDVIISRDVVWTIYDPERAFRRWNELLRKGGRVIIYDGDYRRDHTSMRYHLLKAVSDCIKWVTEGARGDTTQHGTAGNGFDDLPMIRHARPKRDKELLRRAGFRRVEITSDRFRNSPFRMEFWKYGYQGKKFRVIAYK